MSKVAELEGLLKQEAGLHNQIDGVLRILSPDASRINRALQLVEERLYAEALLEGLDEPASVVKNKKYNVTGNTKLRWLLDNESPTFSKVDQSTSENYRRRLLQHYHPDRKTGDTDMFETVKLAHATANIELLAMLSAGIGMELDDSDIEVYKGRVEERLDKLKTNLSFSILRTYLSQGSEPALKILQSELDTRAKLMDIAVATSGPLRKSTRVGDTFESADNQQQTTEGANA